jgi:hypothetical protein
MFIPTNIDKVLVQATHLEASNVKHGSEYKKTFKFFGLISYLLFYSV